MTAPIEFATVRHRCPHCRKSYAHRAVATKHIARCFTNPAVRSCKTCRFYETGAEGPYCDRDIDLRYRCSRCGAEINESDGSCPTDSSHVDRPVYGLTVQCDLWEAS